MNKHYSRMMSCGLMVIAFFLMPVFSASALSAPSSDHNYWKWWYIEQSTGVSVEDAGNTDYGIGTGEYINKHGGGSRADAYTWVKDKYDNAVNATANSVDYYYNVVDDIYNKSVDYAEKGYYTAENALRKTVDSAGKTVYNVSSSDFWNGFYNSMFNGGGYNNIYEDSPNDSYNTSVNNVNYTITKFGVYWIDGQEVESSPFNGTMSSYREPTILNNGRKNGDAIVSVAGGYIKLTGNPYSVSEFTINNIEYDNNNNRYIVNWTMERANFELYNIVSVITLKTGNNGSQVSTGGTPVLQPSQMGFIINPQTGERIPVYTDTTQNPFTINPDGTVTFSDGTTVPIYVDPEDISDDGWLWLLKYIDDRDNTDPNQNPFGQPWNTQNDGTVLGGLFTNLLKDISSIFSGIADTIKKLIDGLIKAIADLFKIDFSLLNNIHLDVDFNIIQTIIDKLLQFLGVT